MSVAKSAEAFRTISEAASELDVPQHVLRHWEDVFGQIRPMRRAGGRRYYRPVDIDLLRGVRVLLYDEGYTTKGVQKIFKENGAKYISEIGRRDAAGEPIDLRIELNEDDAFDDSGSAAGSDSAKPEDDLIVLSEAMPESIPPAIRQRLENLLERLETAQDALDEATLAIEAIDADPEVEAAE